MAYARFAYDSDVYVYASTDGGFTCENCPTAGSSFRCETALEMATHLLEHRAKGHRVPEDAIAELRAEGATRDATIEIFNADRSYKAAVYTRRDGLFEVVVYRMVEDENELGTESYWSSVGKNVVLTDSLERAKALAHDELRACGVD